MFAPYTYPMTGDAMIDLPFSSSQNFPTNFLILHSKREHCIANRDSSGVTYASGPVTDLLACPDPAKGVLRNNHFRRPAN